MYVRGAYRKLNVCSTVEVPELRVRGHEEFMSCHVGRCMQRVMQFVAVGAKRVTLLLVEVRTCGLICICITLVIGWIQVLSHYNQ